MNVRVSQQAKSLQALLISDGRGKARDRSGIENVATLNGGGHIQWCSIKK